ncbi:hypothetical protein OG279_32410 [Streptomyces sp. NBC_01201]|uniref:hypothetical protein n=1 Tax=unclassified Streptomyces TaxID=2593676 RepID=UPI002E155BFB|nr:MULTISPECIES: hypothetical protein [unclassified Streptomyces]WSR05331.1 hypothetical protein OG265_04665 [Streptomyces sp. NBC_01208]WSR52058.1 hypothetical protein OG279_32410 [Streptomyces sp. NBC_01201]
MTGTVPTALIEEVARAVLAVEGVAFLKPGVAQQVRSALSGTRQPGATRAPGLRMSRNAGGRERPWDVDVHIVVLGEARAVDVARGARKAVAASLTRMFPGETAPAHITVTVTGLV